MNSHEFNLKNPLIVALDVDDGERALKLARDLQPYIGAVKVGPRLVVRNGRDFVTELARIAPVFVDHKYLDIPSTMEGAIRATFESGASLATVHAWAGVEALTRLAKVEAELNLTRPFKILAVTILTSFNEETLPPTMRAESIEKQVYQLAKLALDCGLTGVVCSPHELKSLASMLSKSFWVTPGVRLLNDAHDDQKRVETPAAAIRFGASAIVVGRPIIEAENPIEAAERVLASIQEGKSR